MRKRSGLRLAAQSCPSRILLSPLVVRSLLSRAAQGKKLGSCLYQQGRIIGSLEHTSHDNEELMKILLQVGRVPGASHHLVARGLDSVRTFRSIISNDKGTFPIWFQFSLLESSSKDKIPFAESPWHDEFLSLAKGSAMVPNHSEDCSVSFLFKLVQGLKELGGVISV